MLNVHHLSGRPRSQTSKRVRRRTNVVLSGGRAAAAAAAAAAVHLSFPLVNDNARLAGTLSGHSPPAATVCRSAAVVRGTGVPGANVLASDITGTAQGLRMNFAVSHF